MSRASQEQQKKGSVWHRLLQFQCQSNLRHTRHFIQSRLPYQWLAKWNEDQLLTKSYSICFGENCNETLEISWWWLLRDPALATVNLKFRRLALEYRRVGLGQGWMQTPLLRAYGPCQKPCKALSSFASCYVEVLRKHQNINLPSACQEIPPAHWTSHNTTDILGMINISHVQSEDHV